MARLPDLPAELPDETRRAIDRMAAARAHAEGRTTLGSVYLALFHDPAVAERIGDLGAELRFHGVLPDDVRELVILRYAARMGFAYEWSHHQRPAHLAGLTDAVVAAVTSGEVPEGLRSEQAGALRMVDAVVEGRSVPATAQQAVEDVLGTAGVVEVVAVCGLYAVMGYVVTAFDIPTEDGLPPAPFGSGDPGPPASPPRGGRS